MTRGTLEFYIYKLNGEKRINYIFVIYLFSYKYNPLILAEQV